MKYGLGIDTGGTYTDAVIYDLENHILMATAKSVTVKENLETGINAVLDLLPEDMLEKVELVALSTTLATNACVEGRGSRARLVMIGCDSDIVGKYGREYGLPDVSEIIFLQGGHNQQGEMTGEPDWDYLRKKLVECESNTDAFAAVELWGIKNPEFEKRTKEFITGNTGKLTICGHELTGEVNSLKRAASALLNAQLIPLVNDFISAVKTSIANKNINASLVIVRGDGSLMSEEYAREKPVETMISGPAASVAGGVWLTGEKDCIIIDMGGTTSDLAIVEDGKPGLTPEGANVGKWKTGIKSISIDTLGLGGDSLIRRTAEGKLDIGPVRAAPLSWMVSRWPFILEQIKLLYIMKKKHTISLCEFFYLIRDVSEDPFYNNKEKRIVLELKNGPRSISDLAEATGTSIYQSDTARLEKLGLIMRCGLTPTDIMHLSGDFCEWNREAAYYGAEIMANQLDISLEELKREVYEKMKEKLYISIVKLLLEKDGSHLVRDGFTNQLCDLLVYSYHKGRSINTENNMKNGLAHCSFSTKAKLVGIGAPIHIFLPDVSRCLNTDYMIPENAGVANAVGAITGNVSVEETVVIRPRTIAVVGVTGYYCYSSLEKKEFREYQDALAWAVNQSESIACSVAADRGADLVETKVEVFENAVDVLSDYGKSDVNPDIEKTDNRLLIETIVTARATGKIKWIRN
ncbi:MAG: hydantoinase/oxoprolinase family protein [Ruminiclostridium sp.]|nr:hydantoinase/oxoprolinase family protein [Ruminiclostridium sp.]